MGSLDHYVNAHEAVIEAHSNTGAFHRFIHNMNQIRQVLSKPTMEWSKLVQTIT